VAPPRKVTRTPSTGRRPSKVAKPPAAAAAAVGAGGTPPVASGPTHPPTSSEGKLSLTAAAAAAAANSSAGPGPHLAPLVGERIADLVKSIDPNYVIDPEAEEQVLQLADDFLEKVTRQATRLAQHRGSTMVDVQDLQIVLAKNFGIVVPGMGFPNIRPVKSTTATTTAVSSKGGTSGTKRKLSTGGDGSSRNKKNSSASGMKASTVAAAASSSKTSK
jgi:histone H3/H4